MTTRIESFEVPRMKQFAKDVKVKLVLEGGEVLELEIESALGYELASRIAKRILKANGATNEGNAAKYSQFYGMQY